MSRFPSRMGKFDRVTVSTDGPDVIMQLPSNPTRAHWSDFVRLEGAIQSAIKQCQDWEAQEKSNGSKPQ